MCGLLNIICSNTTLELVGEGYVEEGCSGKEQIRKYNFSPLYVFLVLSICFVIKYVPVYNYWRSCSSLKKYDHKNLSTWVKYLSFFFDKYIYQSVYIKPLSTALEADYNYTSTK